jgi:hypothetical protein
MNVALEQTEEYSNGRLTGRFGECFLRGNNGTSKLLDLLYAFTSPLHCTTFTAIIHRLSIDQTSKRPRKERRRDADEQFYTFQHWKIWTRVCMGRGREEDEVRSYWNWTG